ncbi:MAG: hypothetical protein II080_06160 [Lachnospiraceae bacterium]|nr:hypothetical protein [Lachnospiraceae bacterium]
MNKKKRIRLTVMILLSTLFALLLFTLASILLSVPGYPYNMYVDQVTGSLQTQVHQMRNSMETTVHTVVDANCDR